MTATGRCGCGGVRYRITEALRDVINCHCERCRRITGHFMAATATTVHGLDLVESATLRWYEPSGGVFYGFCSSCGSTLFWRTDTEPDHVSIAAGTLDQPSGLRTTSAWWTAEAADYHDLDERIEQHEHEV